VGPVWEGSWQKEVLWTCHRLRYDCTVRLYYWKEKEKHITKSVRVRLWPDLLLQRSLESGIIINLSFNFGSNRRQKSRGSW
jgi:hypothetical protein